MEVSKISFLRKKLLAWYTSSARDLPWRRTKDPYAVWVSEIMLQQTQVDTVIPYYNRWMKKFPDVAALAAAPVAEVMKYWAGLGYYRRVRMLHQAAEKIEASGGVIPGTAEGLMKIPGIGRYTAGAIASIAFGRRSAILDGNVIRILARIHHFRGDILKKESLDQLWKWAGELVPEKRAGDFNQAMMELGATICLPRNPSCLVCPVMEMCEGRKAGRAEELPVKSRREKLEKIDRAAIVLRNKESVLIERQREKERWGGLWMFPHADKKEALMKRFKVLQSEDLKKRLTVRHGFTKYQVTLDVYEYQRAPSHQVTKSPVKKKMTKIKTAAGDVVTWCAGDSNTRWVSVRELPNYAFPSPHQKIVNDLIK